MSRRGAKEWGNKEWSKDTRKRRLQQARAAMDAIDDKYKAKEEEQYLDPDKGFAEFNPNKMLDGALKDGDAVVGLEGEYEFLEPSYPCPVAPPNVGLATPDMSDEALDTVGPYKSLEHAFQAMRSGADLSAKAAIRAAKSGREAKSIGAKSLAKRSKAEASAFREASASCMETLVRDKLVRSADLRATLEKTEERRILHVNEYGDGFWGLKADRTGKNELGKAYARVRDELRKQQDNGKDLVAWCEDRVPSAVDSRVGKG